MAEPWLKYGTTPAAAQAGPWTKYAAPAAPADDGSGAFEGFIKNSPIGAIQGAADFIRHPIDTVSEMGKQNAALFDKAAESYKKGDYTSALFHALNYLLPGGAALDEAGQDFANGHTARGTAKALGIASTLVAGAKAPQILEAAGKAADATPAVIDALKAGAKAAGPDVAAGAAKAAGGVAIGEAIPVPIVNHLVAAEMSRPGLRQVGKGLVKGFNAARESFSPTAPTPEVVAGADPEAAAIVPPELNALAVKAGFSDFASAPDQIKPLLENAHAAELDRLAQAPASPQPTPAAPVPPPVQQELAPVAAAPAAAQTPAAMTVAEQLREMLAPGSASGEVATIAPEVPEVSPAGKAALTKTMRNLPPGAPKAVADAAYAGDQNPAVARATYEAAGRATKSQALSQMLRDEGVTAARAAKWTPEEWAKAADDRGFTARHELFSPASQQETLTMLRKLEKTPKQTLVEHFGTGAPTDTALQEVGGAAGRSVKEMAGADNTTQAHESTARGLPEAGEVVSGLRVRSKIPNIESIDSSLNDAEELSGVREIPMSHFSGAVKPGGRIDARTAKLAEEIRANKEINPLIVAFDDEGPYILEGGHRFDALGHLGHETFPAKIVLDRELLDRAMAKGKK